MPKSPPIVIIVAALLPDLGIGFKGKLPWRLKQEMKYFKDVTTRTQDASKINAVIMGRKTWESISEKFRPLPNRLNVILSRSFKESIENNIIYSNSFNNSLAQINAFDKQVEKIFIMGGAELYNELIKDPRVSHLLITEIKSPNKIEIDTWLKFPISQQESEWKKETSSRLKEFVGSDIEVKQNINEGDFTYNYTLWERK